MTERLIGEQVKYMWVDEDGEQVSSHAKFTAALAFINGWHERVERLKKRDGDVDLTQTNSAVGYRKMSKSGKPPVKLVRVLHVYGDLTPGEQGNRRRLHVRGRSAARRSGRVAARTCSTIARHQPYLDRRDHARNP
jgi:hypothetical protein